VLASKSRRGVNEGFFEKKGWYLRKKGKSEDSSEQKRGLTEEVIKKASLGEECGSWNPELTRKRSQSRVFIKPGELRMRLSIAGGCAKREKWRTFSKESEKGG